MSRLIDADALIDDLKHDVAMDQDSLDYEELTDSNREQIQFDKDCKQNAIDLLQNAPTIEPERKNAETEMVVAHCNVKENAELIARIMDCDVDGEIYQERKKGKWIRWYETKEDATGTEYIPHCKCSECNTEYNPVRSKSVSFCCVCGADMRGEE